MREAQLRDWASRHPYAAGAAAFLKGVPFVGEYTDEALGGLADKIGMTNAPGDGADMVRALQSYEATTNPKTNAALGIGGAIVGTVPMVAALPAGVTAAAPASLPARIAAGAGAGGTLGAVEGAVSGYGSGTTPEERAANAKTRAIVGSIIGTGVGAAAPAVAAGVGAGARAIADRFGQAATAARTASGMSAPATQTLIRAMEADGALTGPGAAALRAAGPDAMLADAGPTARTILDTAMQRSGPAASAARSAIEARAAGANDAVNAALDAALGRPAGVTATETALRVGSAPARSAAYDAAYAVPIDYSAPAARQIETLLGQVPGDVIRRANRLMQLGGDRSRQILADIADDGTVTFHQMPDVRQLDYITRALNDSAMTTDGAGALGGQTAMGRAYQNLSRSIRDQLGTLVPEYGTALRTAADPIRAREALLNGQSLLRPAVTRDQAAEMIGGLTPAELTSMRQGVRSSIDDMLANVSRAATDPNVDAREALMAVKALSSRASREKLQLLLGPVEADRLLYRISQASTGLDLRTSVARNSATYARLAMDRSVKTMQDGGPLGALMEGRPLNATQRAIQMLTGRTPAAKQAAEDQIYLELARALTGPRGPQAQNVLTALEQAAAAQPVNAATADQIARALTAGAGVTGYSGATQGLTRRPSAR